MSAIAIGKVKQMKALWLALLLPSMAFAQCYTIPCRTGATASNSGSYTGPVLDGSACFDANASGTSTTCAFTVPTSGDTVVIGVAARNSGTFTVTDSNSKTYTQIWTASDPSDPAFEAMFYLPNSASGSIAVTVSITVSGGWIQMWAQSISGANATTPLDSTFSSTFVTASTAGTVANGNCGTARTPSQNNTLIFSTGVWDGNTASAGTNYTQITSPDVQFVQYWAQATATSTSGAWVSPADDWIVGCAGFHS